MRLYRAVTPEDEGGEFRYVVPVEEPVYRFTCESPMHDVEGYPPPEPEFCNSQHADWIRLVEIGGDE